MTLTFLALAAAWIWTAEPLPARNHYVEFERTFEGDGRPATLRVAASGEFAVDVNGKTATFGTYRDFPDHPTYNEIAVPTVKGANTLKVEVFHSGDGFGSHADGRPGFWAELVGADGQPLAASGDDGWRCRPMTAYAFGERSVCFGTLDFTYEYDARKRPAEWKAPVAAAPHNAPVKRPVAAPHYGAPIAAKEIYRDPGAVGFDLGTITCGHLEFRVKAPGGAKIRIVNREYLNDGRVKAVNGIHPGDWYISDGLERVFRHRHRYYGCRNLAFEWTNTVKGVEISDVKIVPADYDGFETPPFDCDDETIMKAYLACVKTLRLCWMGRHVSNVWREQAWYPYDCRFEALYDYTLWGMYDESAANLEQMGRSVMPNGFMPPVGPTIKPPGKQVWIPYYTFSWMSAVAEHYLYSGSDRLFTQFAAQMKKSLETAFSFMNEGLYIPPEGPMRWDYLDPYLEDWGAATGSRPNAFYNLYLREALVLLSPLYRAHGEAAYADRLDTIAKKIGERCVEYYYDEKTGLYADRIGSNGEKERIHSHVQYLFLVQGLVPEAKRAAFIDRLLKFDLSFGSYASLRFLAEALLAYGTDAQLEKFHAYVKKIYAPMFEDGGDTIWESPKGKKYGDGSGCICQAWSSFPAWYVAHVLLGVRPTAPGYATYEKHPRLLGGMKRLSGRVMSPKGAIRSGVEPTPEAVFAAPPTTAQVGVWWHWMGRQVSKAGIVKDLDWMVRMGVNSATVFGMADTTAPWAKRIADVPTDIGKPYSERWWECFRFACAEGKKRGIGIGLHNCPGYTSTGGKWIEPRLAMRELKFNVTDATRQISLRPNALFPVYNEDKRVFEKPDCEVRRTDVVEIATVRGVKVSHIPMGAFIQPCDWEDFGLECDKMNPEAVKFHLDHVFAELHRHLGADLRAAGLTHMLLDSYEAGTPTWTPNLAAEFKARRGYDPVSFLPILGGFTNLYTAAEVKKFRADFDRTRKDLYRDVLFKLMSERVRSEGLEFACEPYSGPFEAKEVEPYIDRMMTEFWYGSSAPAVNPGGWRHNVIEAEAFTGFPERTAFTETPLELKRCGDRMFLAGVNRFILHGVVHQPWGDDVKPGVTMGRWGTHFGRNQVWGKSEKTWFDYVTRCQALLQWGRRSSARLAVPFRQLARTDGEKTLYFLVNDSAETKPVDVKGKWFDAVTGKITGAPKALRPDESGFLMPGAAAEGEPESFDAAAFTPDTTWAQLLAEDDKLPEDVEFAPAPYGGFYPVRYPAWFKTGVKSRPSGRKWFTTWKYR